MKAMLRLATLACVGLSMPLAAQSATAILGEWQGTSICVKASWNAACHDEVIVYGVVPSTARAGQVTMHACKIVNHAEEWMGDLELAYDSTAARWAGDFQNSRVHVRWSYRVQGDSLTGQVENLATGQVGRHVEAVRAPASPPRASPPP